MKKKTTLSLNEKIDLILKNQQKILTNEKKILGEELKIEELEKLGLEKEQELKSGEDNALEELKLLQSSLKKNMSSPMKNITKRDIFKGFIGAFIGVMSHFAFTKAVSIAVDISFFRATVLYLVAFAIISVMLYYTGFREIQKRVFLRFMPLRATVLFTVSVFTVLFVNLLFGTLVFPFTFYEAYTLVGASIILAVMGAGAADLLGREVE